MRASVGGRIMEVADTFVDGGSVMAGDVLVRIDPTDAESALARSRADPSGCRGRVGATRNGQSCWPGTSWERGGGPGHPARAGARSVSRTFRTADVATAAVLEDAELGGLQRPGPSVLSRRQAVATRGGADRPGGRPAGADRDRHGGAERALDEDRDRGRPSMASCPRCSVVEGGRIAGERASRALHRPRPAGGVVPRLHRPYARLWTSTEICALLP